MPATASNLSGLSETTAPTLDAERADLLAELATARWNLTNTVRALTDEQAGEHPTVSGLCLGGLIKHVATTEQSWMRFVVEGASAMNFDLPEGVTANDFLTGTAREYPQWAIDRMNNFTLLPGEALAAILADYAQVAAETERIVAEVPDLSATQPLPDAPWSEPGGVQSVRRTLLHIISETAQHAGHADLLRESIDGATSM
jgi:uncharacterized damage-inducible protein DinB